MRRATLFKWQVLRRPSFRHARQPFAAAAAVEFGAFSSCNPPGKRRVRGSHPALAMVLRTGDARVTATIKVNVDASNPCHKYQGNRQLERVSLLVKATAVARLRRVHPEMQPNYYIKYVIVVFLEERRKGTSSRNFNIFSCDIDRPDLSRDLPSEISQNRFSLIY